MLNYAFDINKEKSKTFVKCYKESGDKITVHYSKGNIIVDNNDNNKYALNRKMENQIKEYNKNINSWLSIFNIFLYEEISIFVNVSFIALVISLITGGVLGPALVCSLSSLIPVIHASICIIQKLDSRKFNLFLKYKDEINKRIDLKNKEEEEKNEKAINAVEPKKMKNLCINDINFMKHSDVKKMVRPIIKEEKRIELEDIRYESLGINKSLVKKR